MLIKLQTHTRLKSKLLLITKRPASALSWLGTVVAVYTGLKITSYRLQGPETLHFLRFTLYSLLKIVIICTALARTLCQPIRFRNSWRSYHVFLLWVCSCLVLFLFHSSIPIPHFGLSTFRSERAVLFPLSLSPNNFTFSTNQLNSFYKELILIEGKYKNAFLPDFTLILKSLAFWIVLSS